jgi:hypothetical protein
MLLCATIAVVVVGCSAVTCLTGAEVFTQVPFDNSSQITT